MMRRLHPEGSSDPVPALSENQPAHRRWAMAFETLCEDLDGVNLFEEYLNKELDCGDLLSFWFACTGLKKKQDLDRDHERIKEVIKMIKHFYIKQGGRRMISISQNVRDSILQKISRKEWSVDIFDEAQAEVEAELKNNYFQSFLKSDLYREYCAREDSISSSKSSSESNSVRPLSGVPLPPLLEEQELQIDRLTGMPIGASDAEVAEISCTVEGPLTMKNLMASRVIRSKQEVAKKINSIQPGTKVPNPYHISFTTVSQQDSELQSLSSGALTDDTISCTDSSVDGLSLGATGHSVRRQRRYYQIMKKRAESNKDPDADIRPPDPPQLGGGGGGGGGGKRSEHHATYFERLAQDNPAQFAELLTQKLRLLQREQKQNDRLQSTLEKAAAQVESERVTLPPTMTNSSSNSKNFVLGLMSSIEPDRDESADSILDDHFSRVFHSTGQTPHRQASPPLHSPERQRRGGGTGTGLQSGPYAPAVMSQSIHGSHGGIVHGGGGSHSRRKDLPGIMSMSCDSAGDLLQPGKGRKDSSRRSVGAAAATRDPISGMPLVTAMTPARPGAMVDHQTAERVQSWINDSGKVPQSAAMGGLPGGDVSERGSSGKHSGRQRLSYTAQQQQQQQSSLLMGGGGGASGQLQQQSLAVGGSGSIGGGGGKKGLFAGGGGVAAGGAAGSLSGTAGKKSATVGTGSAAGQFPVEANGSTDEYTVVMCHLNNQEIPYRIQIPGRRVTLAQFKSYLSFRANFKWFFKVASEEVTGAVLEEISEDDRLLPLWEGKVFAKGHQC